MLSIIGTAESGSEHPLGTAVVKYVKSVIGVETLAKCDAFSAVPGRGLKANVSEIENLVKIEPSSGALKEREQFKSDILVDKSSEASGKTFTTSNILMNHIRKRT